MTSRGKFRRLWERDCLKPVSFDSRALELTKRDLRSKIKKNKKVDSKTHENKLVKKLSKKDSGSGGIRTHAIEMTGA